MAIAIFSEGIKVDTNVFLGALALYLLFSVLYNHLRIQSKKGNMNIDYGISYSLSIGLFAGPLGLLLYQTVYRFIVYFTRKYTKTADPDEFLHTFYNIGAFVVSNSVAFYIFFYFYPLVQDILFGFWILMLLLVIVTFLISDLFLLTILYFWGDVRTLKDAIDFLKSRSILDTGKAAITNGLLFLFLVEGNWEILIALFILNYIVSRSFIAKSQSVQNKVERDRFEQMAYTDFLTGISNRAYMDRKMSELNESGEYVGVVVADIDKFKHINDTYNHAVGDHVIQHYANSLKDYLNDDDLLFRSGGEEFTLFLRNRNLDDTVKLVKKIQKGIKNSVVNTEYKSEIVSINYTASYGLYYYRTNETTSMEKAYVYADQLLLEAKQVGKNRMSFSNE